MYPMTRLLCLSLVVVLASDMSVSAEEKDAPKKFTNSLGMEFALAPKGKSWLGGGNGREGKKEVNMAQDFYLGVYTLYFPRLPFEVRRPIGARGTRRRRPT